MSTELTPATATSAASLSTKSAITLGSHRYTLDEFLTLAADCAAGDHYTSPHITGSCDLCQTSNGDYQPPPQLNWVFADREPQSTVSVSQAPKAAGTLSDPLACSEEDDKGVSRGRQAIEADNHE